MKSYKVKVGDKLVVTINRINDANALKGETLFVIEGNHGSYDWYAIDRQDYIWGFDDSFIGNGLELVQEPKMPIPLDQNLLSQLGFTKREALAALFMHAIISRNSYSYKVIMELGFDYADEFLKEKKE